MSTWSRTIGAIALGWIALTCAVVAQSRGHYQDMPLGDVWISAEETGAYQRTPTDNTADVDSAVVTGDVWIAADDLLQTAPAPNQRAETSKNAVTGSINVRSAGSGE